MVWCLAPAGPRRNSSRADRPAYRARRRSVTSTASAYLARCNIMNEPVIVTFDCKSPFDDLQEPLRAQPIAPLPRSGHGTTAALGRSKRALQEQATVKS